MPRLTEQRRSRNTLVGVLAVWLLLITTGIALLSGTGIRINLSGSLPLGFYRLTAPESSVAHLWRPART